MGRPLVLLRHAMPLPSQIARAYRLMEPPEVLRERGRFPTRLISAIPLLGTRVGRCDRRATHAGQRPALRIKRHAHDRVLVPFERAQQLHAWRQRRRNGLAARPNISLGWFVFRHSPIQSRPSPRVNHRPPLREVRRPAEEKRKVKGDTTRMALGSCPPRCRLVCDVPFLKMKLMRTVWGGADNADIAGCEGVPRQSIMGC